MLLSRRNFIAAASGAASAGALPSFSPAMAPLADVQIPGATRRQVGAFQVTALLDGYLDMPLETFLGADAEIAAKLAADRFQAVETRRSPVNAYLVNLGSRLVLIDTGAATAVGPTLGRLPATLAAAGLEPGQIDAILISHMHPDHIAGALTSESTAAFPNAELIVSEADYDYWHDDGHLGEAPGSAKPFFQLARSVAEAYKGSLTRVSANAELFGSIRVVPLPGHTPGHIGFIIESDNEALFIWGDVIHHATYQFSRPDWSVVFDVDPQQAAATRQAILDRVVSERLLVAGMHLPFPGFGHVRESDGYEFVPTEWSYTP